MLYGYQISLAAYDLEKPHKEILETLRGQFGEGKNGRTKNPDLIYSFNWDTEKQTVSYWMTKKHGPAATDDWKTKEPTDPNTWGPDPFVKTYYVYAWSQYEPFFKQIEDVAKNEKKTYFWFSQL